MPLVLRRRRSYARLVHQGHDRSDALARSPAYSGEPYWTILRRSAHPRIEQSIEGRGTIGDFFAGHEDAGVGSLALLSKAAVLLHRCTSFRVDTTGDGTPDIF